MLNKILCIMIIAGLVLVLPVMSGCEEPESHEHVEKDKTVTVGNDGSVRDEGSRDSKTLEKRGPSGN